MRGAAVARAVARLPYWNGGVVEGRVRTVGRKELEALVAVLQQQLASKDNIIVGSWTITYSKDFGAFMFEKCEIGGYCEERPSVIRVDGHILDRGGPLLGDDLA
jgi:hypothetical protein